VRGEQEGDCSAVHGGLVCLVHPTGEPHVGGDAQLVGHAARVGEHCRVVRRKLAGNDKWHIGQIEFRVGVQDAGHVFAYVKASQVQQVARRQRILGTDLSDVCLISYGCVARVGRKIYRDHPFGGDGQATHDVGP